MSNRLAQFIAELFLDQAKLKRYLEDPGAAMAAADLSSEERRILEIGDFHIICKYCRRGGRPTPEE